MFWFQIQTNPIQTSFFVKSLNRMPLQNALHQGLLYSFSV